MIFQPRFGDRQGEDRPRRDGPKILKPLDEVTCFKVYIFVGLFKLLLKLS